MNLVNGASKEYQSALEASLCHGRHPGRRKPEHTHVASASSQLHACTASTLGGPSALMDLWSQDTHLGPGFREKSCLLQEDPEKACFRDSQEIPVRLSGERGLFFRIL